MERRDKYGFRAEGMADEELVAYAVRLQEDRDKIDTFLSIVYEEMKRRDEN
jgi:hypothetical protein